MTFLRKMIGDDIFITTHNHGAGAKSSLSGVGIDTTFYVVLPRHLILTRLYDYSGAFIPVRFPMNVPICESTNPTGLISVADTLLVTSLYLLLPPKPSDPSARIPA